MGSREIAIVMPAYNEAPRISAVIRSLPKKITLRGREYTTTIVVVDDGSHDDTGHKAKKTRAIVVPHVMNCGAGAATRTGLRYVMQHCPAAEYAIVIDADGQHAATDIERMLRHAIKHEADMVVGNRLHRGNKKDIPLHRSFGNLGLSLISRALFGVTVRDTQTGFRLFKSSALPVVTEYTIDRYGFATEMLWLAGRKGLRIHELPISVTYSPETLAKGQNNWGAVDLIMSLLWIRISR